VQWECWWGSASGSGDGAAISYQLSLDLFPALESGNQTLPGRCLGSDGNAVLVSERGGCFPVCLRLKCPSRRGSADYVSGELS
jgi:hypothetical protein